MQNNQESRFILIALVFAVLFGVWFFTIKDVFSPFILSLIMIAFLLPFREHKSIRVLIAMVFTLFMVWLFYYLKDIITPFIISFALAYLFDPVVDILEKRKISRTFSIMIITILVLGLLTLAGLVVIPQFAGEIQKLTTTFPSYDELKERLRSESLAFLGRFGIDVDHLIAVMEAETTQKINDFIRHFTERAQDISSSLSSLMNQLINFILIPFVTFYFLRDFDQLIKYAREKTPERHTERAEKIYSRVDSILSLYIRGKILAAFIIAMVTWVVLEILGVQFGLILGLVTGFLSIIPYVGPILTFFVGIVLGLINPSPESSIIKILAVLGVIQILDLIIISPKVVGEKLGLHPVLLIFSLLVFGKLLGILGLLISIPVTAILKVFVMEWYEQSFLKQEFLRDERIKKPGDIV
ncbi:AI-2E family transporter [bacterium]|nr:MAG: AI-2E family transporter [bacterium]